MPVLTGWNEDGQRGTSPEKRKHVHAINNTRDGEADDKHAKGVIERKLYLRLGVYVGHLALFVRGGNRTEGGETEALICAS
jgi:hypothetical protein